MGNSSPASISSFLFSCASIRERPLVTKDETHCFQGDSQQNCAAWMLKGSETRGSYPGSEGLNERNYTTWVWMGLNLFPL